MIKRSSAKPSALLMFSLAALSLLTINTTATAQRIANQADTDSIPVPGVEVLFVNKSDPKAKPLTVVTDVNGKFRIPSQLVGGSYSIMLNIPKNGKISVDNRQINMSDIEMLTVLFNPKEYTVTKHYLWDVQQKKAFEKPKDGSAASRTNPLPDIAIPFGSGSDAQPTEGAINTSRSNLKASG